MITYGRENIRTLTGSHVQSGRVIRGAEGVDSSARDVGVFPRFDHRQGQSIFAHVEPGVVTVHLVKPNGDRF